MAEIMAPYLTKVYTIDLPNRERSLAKEELCKVLEEKWSTGRTGRRNPGGTYSSKSRL